MLERSATEPSQRKQQDSDWFRCAGQFAGEQSSRLAGCIRKPDTLAAPCEIELCKEIDLDRLACIWYGGKMVLIRYKGYIFMIEANGEVDIVLFEDDREAAVIRDKCASGTGREDFRRFIGNDIILSQVLTGAHPRYCVSYQCNNWWEVSAIDTQNEFHNLEWVTQSDNLFEAIQEVIEGMDGAIERCV